MVSFVSDYIAGAHPEVLARLVETNAEVLPGYGSDRYCESATAKIREACGDPDADVFFLTGGTQTNQVVIDTMLAPWEGVIAAETGHVSLHEAGAIEYTGHKVIELPAHDGRLDAAEVEACVETFYGDENHEHMVYPGMVYISFPTEYGTLYSRGELAALSEVCHRHGMRLYLDGARLAYGLASPACDLVLPDIAELCDAFYIGAAKVGALCGEAAVFPHGGMPSHFLTQAKQHGALLAKGRLLGVQFDALFSDGLYLRIGRHAVELALQMKELFVEHGYELHIDSPTNQQFVVLDDAAMERLSREAAFDFWERLDDGRTVVRFATGWSTDEADLEVLAAVL